jgi:putative addiction module antidote
MMRRRKKDFPVTDSPVSKLNGRLSGIFFCRIVPLICYNLVITFIMQRKICAIGNSQGVSIPVDMLEKLGLTVGSKVEIKLDEKDSLVIIEPLERKNMPESIDKEFVSQVNSFISQYRSALKVLEQK